MSTPATPREREARESLEAAKLTKRLRRLAGQAVEDFAMIRGGDRVMVCLSGGKDSYAMLELLLQLKRKAPVDFELTAVNLDQKQPGFPAEVLPRFCAERGVAFLQLAQDTYSVVKRVIPEGRTLCGLCSRLRRGALYRAAEEHGFTKIALGHHLDDIVATLFLNMFHGSRLKAMPPKLRSDDGRHVVIRPLAYCRERELAAFARVHAFPLIPCTLCGSQETLERKSVRRMMDEWDRAQPGRIENIFRALGHIDCSQLADPRLHDFRGLDAALGPEGRWLMESPGA